MKIYTRKGDSGETGLRGGARVAKDHLRIEACGTLDELNAAVGLVRSGQLPEDLDHLLERLQNELFEVGAELAAPRPAAGGALTIGAGHVQSMEQEIDRLQESLPPLKQFILPAGTPAAAALHLARAICRRAERRLVTLSRSDEQVSSHVLAYMNRLSDLLFVAARAANAQAGRPDDPWRKPE